MASEVFNITIENKFAEEKTGNEFVVQVIPVHGSGHGGTVMPNIQAKQFKFTSSDGYIIFKIKCLNHEIGNKEYITVETNHKVQLSVTNKCWRLKVARKQSNDLDKESPINIKVGRSESDREVLRESLKVLSLVIGHWSLVSLWYRIWNWEFPGKALDKKMNPMTV